MIVNNYPRLGESVVRSELENGLRLITVPRPGFSRIFAFFAVKYGGMDVNWDLGGAPGSSPEGTAHFLEHKMFDMEGDSADLLLAANGAQANAFTDSDMTAYLFECSDRFEENLRILLRFVTEPYFSSESVRKEVGIINQEIGMCEDEPYWRANRNLMDCLYGEHALRNSTVGTKKSIAQITPEILTACHEAFYVPSNMILSVVGDVDPDRVEAIAGQILPQKSAQSALHLCGTEGGPAMRELSEERMDIARTVFMFGSKMDPPPPGGEDFMRECMMADLACDVLFGGSSPLYSKMYSMGLINGSFEGSSELYEGAAYCFARGQSDKPETVVRMILDEAERISSEGIDQELFTRLKRAAFGARLKELNSFEMTAWNLSDAGFRGADYFRFPEWYESISPEHTAALIARTFCPERSALSLIRPLQDK